MARARLCGHRRAGERGRHLRGGGTARQGGVAQRARPAPQPGAPPDRAAGGHRGGRDPAGSDRTLHGREPGGGRERDPSVRLRGRHGARHAARPGRAIDAGASDRADHDAPDAHVGCVAAGRGRGLDRGVGRPADRGFEAVEPGALSEMRAKSPSTVRIMTWNIHGTVGGNPRFDLAGAVALIRGWDADIVALQEVDSRRTMAGGSDPFAVLQDALGAHGIGAKSIATADGEYGQMLISRWPMTASEIHDLSYREREPRRAVKAEIATP